MNSFKITSSEDGGNLSKISTNKSSITNEERKAIIKNLQKHDLGIFTQGSFNTPPIYSTTQGSRLIQNIAKRAN